jgi:hypothetical protein
VREGLPCPASQTLARCPVPGATALVTATAVLRLVADGTIGLDRPASEYLRTISLADDTITVRELLSHTAGVDSPTQLYADAIPDLRELMGPVVACSGPRGTPDPSNGGIAARSDPQGKQPVISEENSQ